MQKIGVLSVKFYKFKEKICNKKGNEKAEKP